MQRHIKRRAAVLAAVLSALVARATVAYAQAPTGGNGTAPPGVGPKLTILLTWAVYCGYTIAVLGVIVAAGGMALAHRRGTTGESATQLGAVLVGALLIGSATALVNGIA